MLVSSGEFSLKFPNIPNNKQENRSWIRYQKVKTTIDFNTNMSVQDLMLHIFFVSELRNGFSSFSEFSFMTAIDSTRLLWSGNFNFWRRKKCHYPYWDVNDITCVFSKKLMPNDRKKLSSFYTSRAATHYIPKHSIMTGLKRCVHLCSQRIELVKSAIYSWPS